MFEGNRITIVINADGTAAIAGVEQTTSGVGNAMKKMEGEHKGILSNMKSSWLGFVAAAYGAYAAISKGWELMELGARADQAKEAFHTVAISYHEDANRLLEDMKRAANGTVDDSTLMQKAIKGMTQDLSGKDITRLMEVARVEARRSGQDIGQTFDELTDAVANNMPRALRRFGLITKEEMSNFGKAVTAGHTDLSLLNIVLARGTLHMAAMGGATENSAERMQKLKANITEIKETIGNSLLKALGKVAMGWEIIGATAGSALLKSKAALAGNFAEFKIIDKYYAEEVVAIQKKWGQGGEEKASPVGDVPGAKKDLDDIDKKLRAIGNTAKESMSAADKANLKWYEGMMKEATEAQKIVDDKKKAEIDLWETKIAESIKYDEYMQGEAEKEIKRQEELNQRKLKLDEEHYQMKKQAYEDSWRMMMDMNNQIGGEAGQGLGGIMAGMKGIMDIEQGYDPFTAEYNRTAQHYADLIQLKIDKYGQEANIDKEWQQIMVAQEQMTAQQRVATYQNMAGMMAGTMYSMYVAAGSHNNAMFTMYKAFAITEAIISTYAGAARALKDFPFPISVAVAGLVTAAGIARVAAIASQKPGGGAATAAGASGGGGYSYSQPTQNQWVKEEEPSAPSKTVNVVIYGNVVDHDAFARELVTSIQKATDDGVK